MERERQATGYGFGTFQGVFTPSILTIIGVILYLRFGWMLGNVGLAASLAVVTAGSAITALFTTRAAVSFLVFTLLYTPCVAAIAAIRREVGSPLRAASIALSQCCVAWLVAFCVYGVAILL